MSNIWTACGEGDFARVRQLVEGGVSPSARDDNTYTPLHAAASWNHADILTYLVKDKHADINTTDGDGETCLFVTETVDMARLIVEQLGGNPLHRNDEGLTAAEHLLEDFPDVAAYLQTYTSVTADPVASFDPNGQDLEQAPPPNFDEPTDELLDRVRQVMQASERGELTGQETDSRLRDIVTQVVNGQLTIGRTIGQNMDTLSSAESGAGTIRTRTTTDEESTTTTKRTRPDEAGR
ncbi:hypothetical protein OIO90_000558 [Microbotryomycetes sp. JL221]|nr:hypothetical protein OIO90_000558 [Microbotryomycetes sp. JL221]